MTVKTAPRKPVSGPRKIIRITTLAENSLPEQAATAPVLPANGTAEKEIRIHRDGLLVAKCYATGLAPSRLFIAIDPLHYPVSSRLEIEFVNSTGASAKSVRLPAKVTNRSAKGIELRLDPEASRQVQQRPA